MRIIVFGAAGFIGTNLAIKLSKDRENIITLVDSNEDYFIAIKRLELENIKYKEADYGLDTDFDSLLENQDVVYHLASTTIPSTSNHKIHEELMSNVIVTSKMLDSCVKKKIKRIIFISSGGTVYGKEGKCPIKEDVPTNPISSYGVQKITIEKLLYLYNYMYGLDYRVVRLSNPYGPYQRPNGVLGAVTTFTYKALNGEKICIYGDGSVVRDYIYIDDAIRGILNIANGNCKHKIFNLGSGCGTSINDLLTVIEKIIGNKLDISYKESRKADVPINYLDISRYEHAYGALSAVPLEEGIRKTIAFMKEYYRI